MDLDVVVVRGVTVVAPVGRLDAVAAPKLESVLLPPLESGRIALLDLSKLRYVSSAGIGVIIQAAKAHRLGGGRFVLCAPSPSVASLLTLSGLDGQIEVHPSREAAIDAAVPGD